MVNGFREDGTDHGNQYPHDYADVPASSNRQYWRRMSRSARMVTPDVLEITSYHDKRLRILMAMFLLIMVGIPFVYALMNGESFLNPLYGVAESVLFVFSPENSLGMQSAYERYKDPSPEGGFETIEQFILRAMPDLWDRFRGKKLGFTGIYFFGILALLSTVLFSARRSPVWFDIKRKEVRTWHKKQLYTGDLYEAPLYEESSSPGHPIFRKSTGHGPMIVELQHIDDPDNQRKFKMGTYPPTNFDQNIDLSNLINAFIQYYDSASRGPDSSWLDPLNSSHKGIWPLDILRRIAAFSFGRNWARSPWPDVPIDK